MNPHARQQYGHRLPRVGDVCTLLIDRGDSFKMPSTIPLNGNFRPRKEPYIKRGEWVEVLFVEHTKHKGWRYRIVTADGRRCFVKANHLQIVGREQQRTG